MKEDGAGRFHKKVKFDPWAVHHKNTAKITQNDVDILAKATNENCWIMLLMREHAKNAEPDLINSVHQEIVDNCFNIITSRYVTDVMAGLYSRKMSPQALAENFYHHFKLLSMKEILLKKLKSKVKILNC